MNNDTLIAIGTEFSLINYWGETVVHTVENIEIVVLLNNKDQRIAIYTIHNHPNEDNEQLTKWNLDSLIKYIESGVIFVIDKEESK